MRETIITQRSNLRSRSSISNRAIVLTSKEREADNFWNFTTSCRTLYTLLSVFPSQRCDGGPFLFMRFSFLLLTSFFVLLLNGTPLAWAETDPASPPSLQLTVRAGVHPDFDRIVFDWPRIVTYSVHHEGSSATLQFEAPAQVHFGADFTHLTRADGFIAGTDKAGHLVISFNIDAKATLKDFISDKSVVIDIEGPAVRAASSKADEVAAKAQNIAPPPAVQTPQPAPQAAAAPTAPAPRASKEKEVAVDKAPPALTPSQPFSTAVVTPATLAAASPPLIPQPLSSPPADKAAPPPPATLLPQPGSATKKLNVSSTDLSDTPLLIASLDPHTPTRAAIFQRAGYGYIIFDRKLTLNIEALTAGQQAPRVSFEPLELPKASGFRFNVPDDVELRANRDGTIWQIFMSKQEPDVPVSTSLVAQPDFALGARFLLPVTDAPEPVHIIDPVAGDELIVLPLSQTEAFTVGRKMADFQILPAAQGLIVKPLTDKVIVRVVSDGIEITADGGLRLSPAIDTGANQQSSEKAKAAAAGKSMFDFSAWRGKPEETFTETRQRLQQTIVDVPEAERNRARLELARFYFAHGNGEEASALLTYLTKQVPDLMAHADFLAILGASKILAYRADEGLQNLDTPLLTSQPEAELWQAVAQAELRNWTEAEEKFSVTETMLAGYPEPFYSRFSVLAIEAALATNKDREAADWLDRLENGPHRDDINPAITYLHGVIFAKTGKAQAAETAWKEVDASHDRLYKIRAELALIDLGVSTHSLTPVQAADQLEALRFGWRGDDLEVDILRRLGEFYIQAKNIKAGLNTLAKATQLYPSSPMTPEIHNEMFSTFHDVFLGDLGKNLSPLDSLTLYQQYRDLMPPGPDGIAVTKNLAERLVAIDLLDQAAALLEDLVKNKLQGDDKTRTSARLAAIRLLDHKPDAALTALDYVKDDAVAASLQNERQLLRAKALSDLHRDDEALALLKDNKQVSAKLLRADINMHAQHWADAAKSLLDLAGPAPNAGEQLTHEQAEWLLNAAIALSLAEDQTGLDKLAIDFGAAMSGTPENDTFRILTQPEKTAQTHDLASAQAKIADVDMFQGYLNGYRKSEQQDEKKSEKPAEPPPAAKP